MSVVQTALAAGWARIAPVAPRTRKTRDYSKSAVKANRNRWIRIRNEARKGNIRSAYLFAAAGQEFTKRDLPVALNFRSYVTGMMAKKRHIRSLTPKNGTHPAVYVITPEGLEKAKEFK